MEEAESRGQRSCWDQLCAGMSSYISRPQFLTFHTCRMGSVPLPISPNPDCFLHTLARAVLI